jgi:hypothetical protein
LREQTDFPLGAIAARPRVQVLQLRMHGFRAEIVQERVEFSASGLWSWEQALRVHYPPVAILQW